MMNMLNESSISSAVDGVPVQKWHILSSFQNSLALNTHARPPYHGAIAARIAARIQDLFPPSP